MNFLSYILVICFQTNLYQGLECGSIAEIENCLCEHLPNSEKDDKLVCPIIIKGRKKLVLSLSKIADGYGLEIDCEQNISISDLIENIHEVKIKNISQLKFKNCLLPEYFDEVMKNITGFNNIISLSLENTGITHINRDFFHLMPNLEIIKINGSNGLVFHRESFLNLQNLKILKVSNNKIMSFSAEGFEIFDGLENVAQIDLSDNKLTSLSHGVFNGLAKLEELVVDNNDIEKFPDNLFLNNREFRKFSFVKTMKCLPHQCKENSTIVSLSETMFINSTVQHIEIKNVFVKSIPSNWLKGCFSLDRLILKNVSIRQVPENLFHDAKNLSYVDLSQNKIETLPDGIFRNLFELQVLVLKENWLKSLNPELFTDLFMLNYIDLSKNQLSNLSGIQFYKQMLHVDFSFNNLNSETDIFSRHTTFEEVKLLNLSHNKLSKFERGWSYNWLGLEQLDLSHNLFQGEIPIQKLDFLKHEPLNFSIDLSNNKIERIIFHSRFPKEKNEENNLTIILSQNPIKCDCFATELKQLLDRGKNKDFSQYYKHLVLEMRDFPCKSMDFADLNCEFPDKFHFREQCSDNCSCSLNRYKEEVLIDCSHRKLESFPKVIPDLAGDAIRIKLILSHNNITTMTQILSDEAKKIFDKVQHLDLSNNNIEIVNESYLPANITYLYLNSNNISKINKSSISYFESHNFVELKLGRNPYQCSCESVPFLYLVKNKYKTISDLANISFACSDPISLASTKSEDICSIIPTILKLLVPILLILLISSSLFILITLNKETCKIWLFAQSWTSIFLSDELIDKDKKYDAFISYSHHDSEYVENILWKELETPSNTNDPAYKCKVHTRDFIPGEMIPDQIILSVQESRRTIIVLSNEYVQADWTRMEFKEAHQHSITDNRQRLIMVVHGAVPSTDNMDKELRAYMKMNSFIHTEDKDFWRKIRSALPRNNKHSRNETKELNMDELKDLL